MPRAVVQPVAISTLETNLSTGTADDLRRMAQVVTMQRLPIRKADLIAVITNALLDSRKEPR